MNAVASKPGVMDRLSGAFLRRSVVAGCVITILTICAVAAYYVQATVNRLENTHQSFNDRQLRNGYVAMSDVQRLVLILQDAYGNRSMSAQAAEDFSAAADFLYVRTDTFRRVQHSGGYMETADNAIAALQRVQALADEAIATDFRNLSYLSKELTARAQFARQALVAFLDDMRRLQDQLLLKQSIAVANQRLVILITLSGLSVLGIAATLLLRREVSAKLARREAEARVRHLAFFDPLTGLPNRVQFQDRLSELMKREAGVALLLVDLDGFKQVNDTHGHAAGDAILQHVATALEKVVAPYNGLASRLGGDEFSIILTRNDLQCLKGICQEAVEAINQPISYEGETLSVAASIGVATDRQFSSETQLNADGLTRAADFALYASKSSGKGQFTVYDEDLERQFIERRQMVEELPSAIADGSLEFFLQPKVHLPSQLVYGFEALARWRRNGVIVPPRDFISIAEESGLIADVDCRVLNDATRHVAAFNRQHGTDFSISVNFSTVHFTSRKFIWIVKDALESSGLRPELLTIEITETVEMHDWDRAKEIIAGIHDLGVRISIDDFGTGFSSLAYLRKTVADEIKIDRSLVMDIETSDPSRFLLDAVLDIARNLDLEVIVEGIESPKQVDIILGMGADSAQGYYFGRPMPGEDALKLALAEHAQIAQKSAS